MDFDVTREQWVARFAMKLSRLDVGADPSSFAPLAESLWPAHGQREPEIAAEEVHAARLDVAPALPESGPAVAAGQEDCFERTERIPVERIEADGDYVRDTGEWIARCIARVLALDPIIKREEAQRSVAELAELERWRVMKPEAAAEQLYTPIRLR